jgi:hypothetical protein
VISAIPPMRAFTGFPIAIGDDHGIVAPEPSAQLSLPPAPASYSSDPNLNELGASVLDEYAIMKHNLDTVPYSVTVPASSTHFDTKIIISKTTA